MTTNQTFDMKQLRTMNLQKMGQDPSVIAFAVAIGLVIIAVIATIIISIAREQARH